MRGRSRAWGFFVALSFRERVRELERIENLSGFWDRSLSERNS
jgi:hypothetical protein